MPNDYLDDPEFQKLIRKYLEYLVNSLPELKANLENHDLGAVRQFGHDMKGSGSIYGFDQFTQLGGEIEAASTKKNYHKLGRLVRKFEENLVQEYQLYVKK